jgi:hypothetical protein
MPGMTIEFIHKPDDFDEFMGRFPAFIKAGEGRWVLSDGLGTTTVTAVARSDDRFVVITDSDTSLHIPWERANKIGLQILSTYKDLCRLMPLK